MPGYPPKAVERPDGDALAGVLVGDVNIQLRLCGEALRERAVRQQGELEDEVTLELDADDVGLLEQRRRADELRLR